MEIGYAIIGTPHGLQCKSGGFISEIDIREYVDLNTNKIVLKDPDRLLRIRRASDGKDIITFYCIYAFAKEMESSRPGTFFGATIVLKNSTLSPELIFITLLELLSNVEHYITKISRRFKSDIEKIPLIKPVSLELATKSLKFLSAEEYNLEPHNAVISKTCNRYEQFLSFLDICYSNTTFSQYEDLYCIWDRKGKSKVQYNKINATLSYETFATNVRKKKRELKQKIEKIIFEGQKLKQQLYQSEKELKSTKNELKDLKTQVFQEQNKLHLLKTEYGKLSKQIDQVKANMEAFQQVTNLTDLSN